MMALEFVIEFSAGLVYSIVGFLAGIALIVACKNFKRKGRK